jgi:hypothetical protein
MRAPLIAIALVMLAACGPPEEYGATPTSVAFRSSVQVTPAMVTPGRAVSMTIELTNTGNLGITADIEMTVSNDRGRQIYDSMLPNVRFEPRQNWNLTQSFLTSTDVDATPYQVKLIIRGDTDGAIYYDEPRAGTFLVSRSAVTSPDAGVPK